MEDRQFDFREPMEPEVGEIHIWVANLQFDPRVVHRMRSLLSIDESQRADRFFFEKDRFRFIAARAMLRLILQRYVNTSAHELQFSYGKSGKPALSNNGSDVQFNLSHSGDLALSAITHGKPVGVDIERIREDVDYFELASRFFSKDEIAAFHSLDENLRLEAFFRCWTRKEAYIKALGDGLSIPLDQFSVSVLPEEAPVIQGNSNWTLQDIAVDPAYAAAVVATAPVKQLKFFDSQECLSELRRES